MKKFASLFALSVLVFTSLAAQNTTPLPTVIVLANVSGSVTVISADGSSRLGASGERLAINDVVRTAAGARCILVFSHGVTISVESETEVFLDTFTRSLAPPSDDPAVEETGTSETIVGLRYGDIVGSVQKLNATSTLNISTPVGVAGIRGTTFTLRVRRTAEGTILATLAVSTGRVEFVLTGQAASLAEAVLDADTEITITGEVDETTGVVENVVIPAPQPISAENKQTIDATAPQLDETYAETVVTNAFQAGDRGPEEENDDLPPAPDEDADGTSPADDDDSSDTPGGQGANNADGTNSFFGSGDVDNNPVSPTTSGRNNNSDLVGGPTG